MSDFALTRAERRLLNKIGRQSAGGVPRFHKDGTRYYFGDGAYLKDSGSLSRLMELGIFRGADDGLFPGYDQTFVLDTKMLARLNAGGGS
jgi:hypothetical protein